MEENSLVPRAESVDQKEELAAEELMERRRRLCRAYNSKEGRELVRKALEMERVKRRKRRKCSRRGW